MMCCECEFIRVDLPESADEVFGDDLNRLSVSLGLILDFGSRVSTLV